MILPKGAVIFDFEGIKVIANEDVTVKFDQKLTNDEIAALFVAKGRQDLLSALTEEADGKRVEYSPNGDRIETEIEQEETPKKKK